MDGWEINKVEDKENSGSYVTFMNTNKNKTIESESEKNWLSGSKARSLHIPLREVLTGASIHQRHCL